MNGTQLAVQPLAAAIEQVLISGDLKALTPAQRVDYYNRVCGSIGLNPLTKPFEYILLNGKLTLYAKRDAADQLRAIHGISLSSPHIEYTEDMVMVTIEAYDKTGRTDADLGAVSIANLKGEARANAILKAVTKAKRRVTLSLAGLGWLDETEVETVPSAQRVIVDSDTGEIVDSASEEPKLPPPTDADLDILGTWRTPQDAQEWAVKVGACANEHEARESFKKIVDANGGRLTKENIAVIYLKFLRRQYEKLNANGDIVFGK